MKSMRQNGKERRRWRSLRRQVRREAAHFQRGDAAMYFNGTWETCAFAAIRRAKAFDFAGAAEQLDEAERYATEAHKVHTELLVREAGGQQTRRASAE